MKSEECEAFEPLIKQFFHLTELLEYPKGGGRVIKLEGYTPLFSVND